MRILTSIMMGAPVTPAHFAYCIAYIDPALILSACRGKGLHTAIGTFAVSDLRWGTSTTTRQPIMRGQSASR